MGKQISGPIRKHMNVTLPEGVMIVIVSGLELHVHEIASPDGGREKEDLHRRVVQRDEAGEQVQVARQEDQRKEELGST